MRSEERLLLELTRAFVSVRAGRTPAVPFTGHVEWDRLLHLAERHQLATILYWLLKEGVWRDDVPPHVHDALRDVAMSAAVAHAVLEREALRVVSTLRDSGIVALVYKGLALGATCYGDPSLRPHQDLDLMLRTDDVERAAEVLRANGYRPEPELARAKPGEAKHWCELNFDKEIGEGLGGFFHVELHWRVLPAFTAVAGEGNEMLPRRRTVSVGGVEVFTPDNVDHLLALALHGAKHRWNELRLVLDVALLSSALSNADIETFRARASAWRVRRMAALAMTLSERLGGRANPIVDEDIERLAAEVETDMFSDRPLPSAARTIFLMRCLDGWKDLGRFLAAYARSEVDRHSGWENACTYALGRAAQLFRA